MLILEHVKQRKKCMGLNWVGYCPFLVLGRDTAVVSRQEGYCAYDRRACVHDNASASVRHSARCTTKGPCRDRR